MSFLVFDVETRVDKRLVNEVFFRGEGLGEEGAYRRMVEQLQGSGSDFFPLSCHVPISIALGEVDGERQLASLRTLGDDEERMVREFWLLLEGFEGTLISFNGKGFDLPVLELQALRYGLALPNYFGDPRRFRGRAAERHFDLYDFFSNAGATRLRGGFDLLARLAGLPGKSDMDGARVQETWEAGRLEAIHRYCRDDVLQTYLLFVRAELMRGRIAADDGVRLTAAALAAHLPRPPIPDR